MRVIVAGGGIVGLTAGAALRRAGAEVVVAEQAREIRAAGASIGLWANALEVLGAIGIGERVAELGTGISTWFYDASGRPHRSAGHGEEDHAFLLVPRPELNQTLADAVGRENIVLHRRVVGFVEDADGVTVRFSDGSEDRADLLVGADGVFSKVREQLLPGSSAREHVGHFAWRGVLPTRDEPAGGSVLTVGRDRARGGYTRTYGGMTMWMVNQFDCAPLVGTVKQRALERAALISENGWNEALFDLIEATPDEAILENQIMFVPELPRWTSDRVVLVGDAAHGLSPHIAAGGTLGVEDIGVLTRHLVETGIETAPGISAALQAYEADRMPRYAKVREHSRAVEGSADAREYADTYAAFSHWMLSERPKLG